MAEATPGPRPRPLSPHVLNWRWHISAIAPILNRAAGSALYLGLLIVAGWAVALASGRDAYETYAGLFGSIPGRVVLFAVSAALFFHMANGVRHLAWDSGKGFAPKTANATAWGAFAFALAAAVGAWSVAALTGVL